MAKETDHQGDFLQMFSTDDQSAKKSELAISCGGIREKEEASEPSLGGGGMASSFFLAF